MTTATSADGVEGRGRLPASTLARSSGVLMHVTSLPSPDGIGDIGAAGRQFVDWLERAGQRHWQVLPLVLPANAWQSPYDAVSTFAGNRLLLSLDDLVRDGLLPASVLDARPQLPAEAVDFEAVTRWKQPLVRRAAEALLAMPESDPLRREFESHVASTPRLGEYVEFMELRRLNAGAPRGEWPLDQRARGAEPMPRTHDMDLDAAEQFLFTRQLCELRAYAHARKVHLIGDLPIYVSDDSADVWANPKAFQLDDQLRPRFVGGTPPTPTAPDGQNWGAPVFDWDTHRADGFRWWRDRMSHMFDYFDAVRFDHFLGVGEYWAIPAGQSATSGHWQLGPGTALIECIMADNPGRTIIAEDLGELTPARERFIAEADLPSSRVLQKAYFARPGAERHVPSAFGDGSKIVCYTTTHDNDTAAGWAVTDSARQYVRAVAARAGHAAPDPAQVAAHMLTDSLSSSAVMAITPLQDIAGLGSEARMNTPGTVGGGNWRWRAVPELLSDELADDLRRLTGESGRL